MPDLNEVYRRYLHDNPPNYTDLLMDWIEYYIQPFRLTEIRIWLQPDFRSAGTSVIIEVQNWPEIFTYTFKSADFLENRDNIAQTVAQNYAEWLQTLTVPPEDHIELGEN